MTDDRFVLSDVIGRRNWPTLSLVWRFLKTSETSCVCICRVPVQMMMLTLPTWTTACHVLTSQSISTFCLLQPSSTEMSTLGQFTHVCSATGGVGKWVRSTNLSHSREWFNVLYPRSDRIDYTVICFVMYDCICKLWKQYECELSVV